MGADDDPRGGSGGTAGEGAEAGAVGAGAPGMPGSGGEATGVAGAGESGAGSGIPTACGPLAPRLIRLTFPQILNSVQKLAGTAVADELRAELGLGAGSRAFPPLSSAEEGSVVNDSVLAVSDRIAERTAAHMAENMESVTGCSPAGDLACVETYLTGFAALAYRRGVDDADIQDVLTVTGEAEALQATPAEVLRTGIHLILSSPSFLYRTEFGSATDTADEVELTGDEIANALSFFLSDAPPDATLVAAVDDGSLSTPEGFARETARLLESPEVRANLARSMADLLGPGIETAVIEDASFTAGLRAAAAHELVSFVGDRLFSDQLGALLTQRETRVNAELASLYGVAFPPSDATVDADGFAPVTLPEDRAGFLTLAAFLASVGGPAQGSSTIHRGLHVNRVVTCGPMPPSHDSVPDLEAEVAAVNGAVETASQRERTDYRLAQGSCAGCHQLFEPYGIALEAFDRIGRSRTVDEVGAAIRAETTLPDDTGGAAVNGAAEMAAAVASSGAFTQCTAQAYVRYALAEERPELDVACEVASAVARAEDAGDVSFARVAAAIAEATALRPRSRSAAKRLP